MPRGVAKDPSKDKRRKWKGKKCPQRAPKDNKIQKIEQIATDVRSQYTIEERYAIALEYALTGNVKRTARNHGIDPNTIRQWRKRDWWKDMMEMRSEEHTSELQSRLRHARRVASLIP